MRVALMGRSLRGRMSGVVRYTAELIAALSPRLRDDLSVLVTRADHGLSASGANLLVAPFPTPNEYARAFWEQAVVPVSIARLRPDVYHSPNYILPVGLRCPAVVTIHDLAFTDPSLHRLRSRLYLSTLTRLAVRKAVRIICVSEDTRRRLLAAFPDAADRVRVIGEGVDARFRPEPPGRVADFRERYGLERPYVLFVGTAEPRKNLPRLVEAFGGAVVDGGLAHDLVLAGSAGWMDGPFREALERSPFRHRVRRLGYVPDDLLPSAYTGADLVAYPSLGEGYGLPVLEAMACGTPVLTSDRSALPEVAGGAAALVDPTDSRALAEAIVRLLTDPLGRQQMAEAGLRHVRRFRWPEVAERTLTVYREAAS